jgi:cold shock CspA family protein
MYRTNDIVLATLSNAARDLGGSRCFGFAEPLGGGPAIYVHPDAMTASGLTKADVGARVELTMQDSNNPAYPPFAVRIERDDSLIDGEEPDAIELAILQRLSGMERKLAAILCGLNDRSRIEEV